MKEFKTRIIILDHFQKIHVDKEPDIYPQNLDKLIDLYEESLEDSNNTKTNSDNV